MRTIKLVKEYVKIYACVSDLHVGSMYAIQPPDMILKDGSPLEQSKLQYTIWEYWLDFVKQCDDFGVTDIIVAGDVIHGVNKKVEGENCRTTDVNSQRLAAYNILKLLMKNHRKFFFVRGTEYHDKTMEQGLCEDLGGQWADLWGQQQIVIGNITRTIDVTHQAPLNEETEILYGWGAYGKHANVPKNDVYVRGHWHTCHISNVGGVHYIKLPCWTALESSMFMAKRKSKFQYQLDIGGVLIFVDTKGQIETKAILQDKNGYRYEVPVKEII